jgi:hypothetical protein
MHDLATTPVFGLTQFFFNPQRKKISIAIKQETGSGGFREEENLLPLASHNFWFPIPQLSRL